MAKRAQIKFDKKAFATLVKQKIDEVYEDEANLKEIATKLLQINKRTIRKGIDPLTGEKFPKNTKQTIERRKQMAQINFTDPSYGPNKSNLTFTGQLVEAMKASVAKKQITIEVEDSKREPLVGAKGKLLKTRATNLDVQKGMRDIGRNMLGMTEEMTIALENFLIRKIKQKLRTLK